MQSYIKDKRQVAAEERKYWKHVDVSHMTEEETDDEAGGQGFIRHQITWRSSGNVHHNFYFLHLQLYWV